MTSVVYASLGAFLLVWLSLNVIKIRREKQIGLGDGHDAALKTTIVAQSNLVEYLPVTLILLFVLEYNQASLLIIHLFGVLFIIGRVIHADAMLNDNFNRRVLGVRITIWVIIGLALANLLFFPYRTILSP